MFRCPGAGCSTIVCPPVQPTEVASSIKWGHRSHTYYHSWWKSFYTVLLSSLSIAETSISAWCMLTGEGPHLCRDSSNTRLYRLVGRGDKIIISKFSILTTGELFIGYIQTMFGFWTFRFGAKNPLRTPSEDFDPPGPPQGIQVPQNGCWEYSLGYFFACIFFI